MDQSGHACHLSRRLEDLHTRIRNRTRSTHISGSTRTSRKNENRSVLLGRGYYSWRPPRKNAARRRWLSGNDRLRPRRKSRALNDDETYVLFGGVPTGSEGEPCWLVQSIQARPQFPWDAASSRAQ